MPAGIRTLEGSVAVRFLESGDATKPAGFTSSEQAPEAVLATIVAIGPKSPVKVGDEVFVRPYAQTNAVHIDAETVVISTWDIVAIVD